MWFVSRVLSRGAGGIPETLPRLLEVIEPFQQDLQPAAGRGAAPAGSGAASYVPAVQYSDPAQEPQRAHVQ